MNKKISWENRLSRRERQVMNILLSEETATAAEIQEKMPEAPGYSAVRAVLRVMEKKGMILHESEGPRYVYKAAIAPQKARQSILKQVLQTLFNGSREQLVAALIDSGDAKISEKELKSLIRTIQQAHREGR